MAGRQIERSEKGVWKWVLAGLLALALIALILSQPERDPAGGLAVDSAAGTLVDSAPSATATARARNAAAGAVNDYLSFVERNRARVAPDSSHAYTANGVRLLTDALAALAARDTIDARSVRSEVIWLRARADSLYRDWRSRDPVENARHARDALLTVADLVQSLHERRYSDIAIEAIAVTDAARAVNPGVSLLDQRVEIQRFFDRAADAVRAMAMTGD
jgi:hypothetical protein